MRFEFATATRIVFGPGALKEAGPFAKSHGSRALVVTGRNVERAKPLWDVLTAHGVGGTTFSVPGEPEVETVLAGVRAAKGAECAQIISFGGGSAIDAGKAIAAMLSNDGHLLDYLEVIGKGQSLQNPPAPFMAIPTTAGTGSEVTRNAVLSSPEHHVKVSLRSPLMLPKVALVDPELTCGLPPAVTASTGLDALTQLIEPFVCPRSNPVTDSVCREGLARVARSLRTACEDGRNAAAREDMSLAALFGGLALANAGLGAVHGFAGPLGGMFDAPHGAVCAALLPHVMEANLAAVRLRAPGSLALQRYEEIALILTGQPGAAAEAGVEWVGRLIADLGVPPLSRYGLTRQLIPELVEKAGKASSMKANPVALSVEELNRIAERSL